MHESTKAAIEAATNLSRRFNWCDGATGRGMVRVELGDDGWYALVSDLETISYYRYSTECRSLIVLHGISHYYIGSSGNFKTWRLVDPMERIWR